MCEIGVMYTQTGERVCEIEIEELENNTAMSKDVFTLAKTVMRMNVFLGLGPAAVTAGGWEREPCLVALQSSSGENPGFGSQFSCWYLLRSFSFCGAWFSEKIGQRV